MSYIPINGTSLPSADLDIRPSRYLYAFKRFQMTEHDAIYLLDLTDYEIRLCRVVDRAYSTHNEECAPRQAIMKSAMRICGGAMNPVDVRMMIDSVYDFYYGVTEEYKNIG